MLDGWECETMSLSTAIKKAAATLQIAIAPHELGSPVEGTTTAAIVPAAPNEDQDLADVRAEAARIITQLERSKPTATELMYSLDEATREQIRQNILAGGPSRDAIIETADGRMLNLDGSAVPPLSKLPRYPDHRSAEQKQADRAAFLEHKKHVDPNR